jgi:hypothetical protein
MEAIAASELLTPAPQTTLVAASVVEPQTTLNPCIVLVPHTTDDPHTTELPETFVPHTTEVPHTTYDPHTTELLATLALPLVSVTFPVEELYETLGDNAAPTFDDARSVLAKAACRSRYPAPMVNAS